MLQPEGKSFCYQADLAGAALGKLAADVRWHADLPSILFDLAKVKFVDKPILNLVHSILHLVHRLSNTGNVGGVTLSVQYNAVQCAASMLL